MDKRIQEIFGNSKIYDVDGALLLEKSMCVSIFKKGNKPILITSGKIFCAMPAEVIPISDVKLLEQFSSIADVAKYIKNGVPDARLENQKKLIHTLRVFNKLNNKRSAGNIFRRDSVELLN